MNQVRIIGVPQSNYVRTVRIAAEEMGIPYLLEPERPHTPPVSTIHPLGKVPVMRHGDITLFESRAIIAYFERAFEGRKLTPENVRSACEVEQWVSLLTTSLIRHLVEEYLFAYLFPGTSDGSPDRKRIEAAQPKLESHLALLDREASRNGYIGSGNFSLADAYFFPVLHYLQGTPESAAIISASAELTAYEARCAERASVKATVPEAISAEDRDRAARLLAQQTT